MKIKEGFLVRNVAGSYVVVAMGEKTVDFNGIMTLNETGYFLWELFEKGCDKDGAVKALLAEYEVDEKTAQESVERFLETLRKAGCVEGE